VFVSSVSTAASAEALGTHMTRAGGRLASQPRRLPAQNRRRGGGGGGGEGGGEPTHRFLVTFASPADAARAIEALNGSLLLGSAIACEPARNNNNNNNNNNTNTRSNRNAPQQRDAAGDRDSGSGGGGGAAAGTGAAATSSSSSSASSAPAPPPAASGRNRNRHRNRGGGRGDGGGRDAAAAAALEWEWECELCGVPFPSRARLSSHLGAASNGGGAPDSLLVCPGEGCGASFCSFDALVAHVEATAAKGAPHADGACARAARDEQWAMGGAAGCDGWIVTRCAIKTAARQQAAAPSFSRSQLRLRSLSLTAPPGREPPLVRLARLGRLWEEPIYRQPHHESTRAILDPPSLWAYIV